MAGEQAVEPVTLLPLAEAHEGLLQRDRTRRIVAGTRHVSHAVFVGFQFGAAPVGRVQKLRTDGSAAHRELAEVVVARHHRGSQHRALQ